MLTTLPSVAEIKALEEQLQLQKDDLQRLAILDKLIGHYAYTDVLRAQKFLAQQKLLLSRRDLPDFRLTYYMRNAFVENQLYNYKLAQIYCRNAIELIEERGDVQQQTRAYIDYAGICTNYKQLASAEEYIERAERLLTQYPDSKLNTALLCNKGYLYLHYGEMTEAISMFLEALKLSENSPGKDTYPDYYVKSLIYNGLGTVYMRIGDFAKAIKAHLQGANICETMGMRTRLSWFYNAVGTAYLSLDDSEAAEQYFLKSINLEDDISQLSRAGSYASMGVIYAEKEQYERAFELFDRAEKLYLEKKTESQSNLANIELKRANLYKKLGKYKKALRLYKSAYKPAHEVEDYRLLAEIYNDFAECYALSGDYTNAYEYQVLHDGLAKKAAENEEKQKINELGLRFEAVRARQEREMMRLQTVELQAKALRAQMNPHFLFNALNSIQNFISGSDAEGADDAVKFLASFSSLMRKSLEYSERRFISLEDEIIFLKEYLDINAKLRFEDRLSYEIIVDEDIEEDIMGVPTMVIQPYVENAIEHGLRSVKDGKVSVQFILEDEETILCIVEDNGIGRENRRKQQMEDPRYQNHRSLGTAITEERLKIAHKDKEGKFVKILDVKENEKAAGTKVMILIPISDL